MNFEDKKILIIGMARSGVAAARVLAAMGAEVTIADQKSSLELSEAIAQLQGWAINICPGGYPPISKEKFDLVVTSPGVPMTAQPLREAVAHNIPVWGEIELAARLSKGSIVAITGTNGKTTTTALIGQMFKDAGKKVVVGGNIGLPLIQEVQYTTEEHVLVVEVSSFQLEWVEGFHPKVAVITNITPDHLDRHGSMANYAQVKSRIFSRQTKEDYTVLNYDDPILREMGSICPGRVIFFSREHNLEQGIVSQKGKILVKTGGQILEICREDELKIPGAHNLENALAAVAAGRAMGLTAENLRNTLCTFPGVAHRLEKVAEIKGVTYINDSKGTNPDASIKALEAFSQPLVLIAGGSTKGSDFSAFARKIKERVKHLVVLGQTAEDIIGAVEKVGFKSIHRVQTFPEAVHKASELAEPGEIVLLSPACASYDMFKNYEHRGETFKELVRQLTTNS
ncbi:UDP-N-acetylmuramoyl-L-alanine--D-glutamate ligase [Zhaonella formicivorans]|jgi:UDP-N-acetylmuramoylalanine--D-glutamate ligase|uniref:UDP-N-acetylmuramoyl-L-alanine--D-glutamate ligase n=1 Tax=Zhaonella formicivorans TaxID=2528593 RepID=UPI0010D29F30|nr:UDP-N-acetylmuramoyl-L-alanine--D-glutamate ligase [Zhaonella formicivorans]